MKTNLPIHLVTLLVTFFILLSALFSETGLVANNTGAPAMRTGSPGDTKSCTICHTGTAQQVTGIITTNIPPAGYVPGATYIIDALCVDPTRTRFGFEISPQNATGAKLGVLSISDAVRTKLVGSGKYITHTSAGTSGAGSILWSFNWTAPPTGSGDVTFYGAFNFSNHNNSASGDLIKLSQLTVGEDLNVYTQSINYDESFTLYPNPVKDHFSITMADNFPIERISIFDMNGRQFHPAGYTQLPGKIELNISNFPEGTYFVSFATQKRTFKSKVIKQE